jgi:hypothetical protein
MAESPQKNTKEKTMTVLDRKATVGIDVKKAGQYLAVAALAGAIGVGGALGLSQLGESNALSPAEISQIRAEAYVAHLENQWIAQVNAVKIQEQRAADMVEHYSNLYQGELARNG